MRFKDVLSTFKMLDCFRVHPWVPVTMAWRVPWVADGGVGLQVWRLAANILNKQSWTADQEWSSSLGVWREANNLTL